MSARRWRTATQVARIRADRPPTGAHSVPKLALVDRLVAMGKWRDVRVRLLANELATDRWHAAVEIYSNDAQVRSLLAAAGLTSTQIDRVLAPAS